MEKAKLVLDFNSSDLHFSLNNISQFNIDTIYNNINEFYKFINESVLYDSFDKVFNSSLFQMSLLDDSTCYINNLLAVYNGIAENNLLDEKLPKITTKQLVQQLRIRGYDVKHTTVTISKGKYKHVRKVIKNDEIKWFS